MLLTGLEVPLTTLFLARVNLESGEITYCNAGHPPALLFRENHEVEELPSCGPVLGAISRASFANGNAQLLPGGRWMDGGPWVVPDMSMYSRTGRWESGPVR